MQSLEDQIFIDKVLRGDTSAFRFLVERYKRMVYSIALKVLNNPAEAEDAAQEAFIKAYQQLHTFERKAKFSTWLYTLSYRHSLNKLREAKSAMIFLTEEVLDSEMDSERVASEVLVEGEQSAMIKAAIDRLPRQEGLLVLLYYYEEKSIKEIEEITGLTASNIKVKLFRARKTLEVQLKFLV